MTAEKETAPEGAVVQKPNHESHAPQASDDQIIAPLHDNPCVYDTQQLLDFVDTVFHVKRGEVLVQVSKRAPRGFGATPSETFTHRLNITQAPMRAYYGTSTLSYTDGVLRHSKSAFVAFHAVVLDDVGTKIPESKIPSALAENYKIESSPGNFQLGYILKEPITDYDEAQLLINLFVDAGLTDAGGAMPCKKVRLPCGVNGKKGPNEHFQVKLVGDLDPTPWDVQELLDAAGIEIVWAEHRKLAKDNNHRTKRLGASAWNPDLHYVDPHTGVYDPVLEWLYEQNMVIQDGDGPFFDIVCPFHHEHSDKGLEASLCGYSPIGHGLLPHKRVFACFHSHGAGHTATDYLDQIMAMGGPDCPAVEFAPEDMVKYIYDMGSKRVFDMKMTPPRPFEIDAVNITKPKVRIPNGNGGMTQIHQLNLWLRQPSCVKVFGAVQDPGAKSLVVEHDGVKKVNMATFVDYPIIAPNAKHVDKWLDYIEYLIPDKDERDYFHKWLACKIKDPTFRGAGMVLVSQTQGVGKSLLYSFIERMWGEANAVSASMDDVMGTSAFNEYLGKHFCCVHEIMNLDDAKQRHRIYNRLKDHVDPAAQFMTINPKYGVKYQARAITSFLLLSNNLDALTMPTADRRFHVMQATEQARPDSYFTDLCEWRDAGEWRTHIWNYYRSMDVDVSMYGRAPESETKKEMIALNKHLLEHVVDGAIAVYPSALVPLTRIKELLIKYVPDGVPEAPTLRNGWAGRVFREQTVSMAKYTGLDRIHKVRHSLRDASYLEDSEAIEEQRTLAYDAMTDYSDEQFKQDVDDWLNEHDVEII